MTKEQEEAGRKWLHESVEGLGLINKELGQPLEMFLSLIFRYLI
jgi:hypothetical protein